MAEATLELRTILEAAERAATAEDFVSAEQHLRQAAVLQEQQLGPGHPDLANTLNNLGIVCEYVGKPTDAEACYRRAYRIASAALPADHPLVQTSGQNLRDFCEATGKSLEPSETTAPALEPFASELREVETKPKLAAVPPPPPAAPAPAAPAPPRPAPVAPPAAAQAAKPASPSFAIADLPIRPAEDRAQEPSRPTAATRVSSPVTLQSSRSTTPIAVALVLILVAAAWWFGLREPSAPATPASARTETAPPAEEAVVPREDLTPPATSAAPETPATQTPPENPPITEPRQPAAPEAKTPPPSRTVASGDVSVVDAKVCRSLSTSSWTCTPATNPAAPGAFVFYTRVRSARDTTVQHRWLMDGRLLRSVSLRIRANPGAGYRTYSRNSVGADRRGNWTIELRDGDGALLHEERFTVQ